MNEDKMPDIIENSAVDRVLPLKSTLFPVPNPSDTATGRSEFLDDDERSLVGEVYAG